MKNKGLEWVISFLPVFDTIFPEKYTQHLKSTLFNLFVNVKYAFLFSLQ